VIGGETKPEYNYTRTGSSSGRLTPERTPR
jgi:hypothetical protein